MTTRVQCPHCGTSRDVPSDLLGKKGRCSECRGTFMMTSPEFVEVALAEDDESNFTPEGIQKAPKRSNPLAPADDSPRSRGRRPKPSDDLPPKPPGGLLVLLLVGGALTTVVALFVLGGVAVFWLLRSVPPASPMAAIPAPAPLPATMPAPRPKTTARTEPPPPPIPVPKPIVPPPFVPPQVKAPPFNPPAVFNPPPVVPKPVPPPKKEPDPPPAMVWKVQPDPLAEAVKVEKPNQPNIPVKTWGTDLIYPSTPSPFVAVGNNLSDQESRQVWDLRTMKPVGTLAGKLDLAEPFVLSPDGASLVGPVPSKPGSVDVWSPATGKSTRLTIDERRSPLELLDFAGPGKLLVGKTDTGKKVFQLWDIAAGRMEKSFPAPTSWDRESAAFSPNRKYLAVTAGDKLSVFDVADGSLVGEQPLPKGQGVFRLNCTALAFSPDGAALAGLFRDGPDSRLLAWDFVAGKLVADHKAGGDFRTTIRSVALYKGRPLEWLPDRSGWLLYGKAIIDRDSGKVVAGINENVEDPIPGPRRIIGADHVAVVVGELGKRTLSLVPLPWERIRAAKAGDLGEGPGGGNMIKSGDVSGARLVTPAAGATPWQAAPDPAAAPKSPLAATPIDLSAAAPTIRHVLFSAPDVGRALVVSGSPTAGPLDASPLKLDEYDLTTGKLIAGRTTTGSSAVHAGRAPSALSPDGTIVAVRDMARNRRIDVWSVADGKSIAFWDAPESVTWLALLDAKRLLTVEQLGTVTLWSLPDAKPIYRLTVKSPLTRPALSPGRKYLAVANGETFDLYDPATAERRGRLEGVPNLAASRWSEAAFGPDGQEIAAVAHPAKPGEPASLVRWSLKTGAVTSTAPVTLGLPSLHNSTPGKATGTWSMGGAMPVSRLAWWGRDHLLLNREYLYDIARKRVVWRFQTTGFGKKLDDGPDERLWFVGPRTANGPAYLSALTVPEEVTNEVKTALDPAVTALLKPGDSVSLKLDWNTNGPPSDADGYRRLVTEMLTAHLKALGVTVAENGKTVVLFRAAVTESDKQFTVGEVFGPFGRPLPRPPIGKPETTFKGKRLMAQLAVAQGEAGWQQSFTIEPSEGRVGVDEDAATLQLNRQWEAVSSWLTTVTLPYYVAKPPATEVLPGTSQLTPDGIKPMPGR